MSFCLLMAEKRKLLRMKSYLLMAKKRKVLRMTAYLLMAEKRKVLRMTAYLLMAEKRKVLRMTRMTHGRRWTKSTLNLQWTPIGTSWRDRVYSAWQFCFYGSNWLSY